MANLPLPLATAMLLALTPGASLAQRERYEIAQGVIRQRVVVRVPRLPARAPAIIAVTPIKWVEKKGPKCIPLGALAGVLVTEPRAVDMVFTGGGRVRAKLDKDCPAMDFYRTFYLKSTADGQICAGRDALRSRAGRACGIEKFRALVPKR